VRGDFAGWAGTLSEDAGLWDAYAKAWEGAKVPACQRPHYARWIATIYEVCNRPPGNADGTVAYQFCVVGIRRLVDNLQFGGSGREKNADRAKYVRNFIKLDVPAHDFFSGDRFDRPYR
jgi:hypothetical protein